MADAPLKLPTGSEWNGSHEAFVAFMTAVFRNCPNTRSSCGTLPKQCSLCEMLCNQETLNHCVYAWEIRTHLKEWREVDRTEYVVEVTAADTANAQPPPPEDYRYPD